MSNEIIFDKQKDELSKFVEDVDYHKSVQSLKDLNIPFVDVLHHNTAFVGKGNIARTLCLYELYKKVLGLAGHIAEVGVWKGASFLFFAKLVELFEPQSNTLVHGFDNFEGMQPSAEETGIEKGSYQSDYKTLRQVIDIQKLGNTARLHKMDVTKDLEKFFNEFKATRFKLVFLDAGIYHVLKACLPLFWSRLLPGGIIVFDQFNYEDAYGETKAVTELLSEYKVQSLPWTRSPSGYIIKPELKQYQQFPG